MVELYVFCPLCPAGNHYIAGNAKSEKLPQTSKPDSLGFDTIDHRRNWEALACR